MKRTIFIIMLFTILTFVPNYAGALGQNENGIYGIDDNGALVINDYMYADSDGDGIDEAFWFNENGFLRINDTWTSASGILTYKTNEKGQWIDNITGKVRIKILKLNCNKFFDIKISHFGTAATLTINNKSSNLNFKIYRLWTPDGKEFFSSAQNTGLSPSFPFEIPAGTQKTQAFTYHGFYYSQGDGLYSTSIEMENDLYLGSTSVKFDSRGNIVVVSSK